jgi:hypothetical protein
MGGAMKRSGNWAAAALAMAIMAGTAWAQTPASAAKADKSLRLSHVQQLQIEDYAKDVKLAQQQIELLKVQLAGALLSQRQSEQNFVGYLAKLRTDLNAPASAWDFDAATLSFVPKGSLNKPVVAAKAAPVKTKKPGGA